MKKQLLMTIAAIMTVAILLAQSPSKMSYESVIRNASNDLKPQEEQKIMVIHEDDFHPGIETGFNKNKTIQDQTTYYEVIIAPVTKNKSALTNLLLKFSDPDKRDSVMELVRNVDMVMQKASSIASQLRKPGANYEVIRLKTENTNDSFLVRIMSAGKNEQKVIKMVRDLRKLSKEEAQRIVYRLGVVAENLSQKEAENIKKTLEAAGAKVRIEEMPSSKTQTQFMIDKKEKKKALKKTTGDHKIKMVEKQPDVVSLSIGESKTEYKRLLTQLNDQLDVKTDADSRRKLTTLIKDKNQRKIINLVNKTGWDARFIRMMALAQEKSAETGLPAQLFYAIYRTALPTGETALFITDASTVRKIWKGAIKQHIIDASFEGQLDVYLQKFIQQKQIPLVPDLPREKDDSK